MMEKHWPQEERLYPLVGAANKAHCSRLQKRVWLRSSPFLLYQERAHIYVFIFSEKSVQVRAKKT